MRLVGCGGLDARKLHAQAVARGTAWLDSGRFTSTDEHKVLAKKIEKALTQTDFTQNLEQVVMDGDGRQPGTPSEAAGETWPVLPSVHTGYLTLRHAAEYLGGVSTATVRRWISGIGLPYCRIPGGGGWRGRLLFRQRELDRWMRRFKGGLKGCDTADVGRWQ